VQNTADHATWRSIEENRGLERLRDAEAHRITRNNPITRTQDQRANTVHHRNTRLQQRFREQRILTYRSNSQNRQAESFRQSQRNISARAQLSEDEREDQRERQRRRSRATAREQYLRNIKDGPTKCCGGTWFPSQVSGLNIRTICSKYPNFSLDNAFYLPANINFVVHVVKAFPKVGYQCLKNLTCLEERLISPRIPFMRIISLEYGNMKGNAE